MPPKKFQSLSDQALLRLWWTGDGEAGNFLCERHHDFIHLIALSFVKNRTDAQDICQKVWISLFKTQQGDLKNLRAWLQATTKNKCIDFGRKKWNSSVRKIDFNESQKLSDDPNPEQKMIAQDQSKKANEIIDLLPPLQAKFFRLRVFQGLSYQEIAEQHNASTRAVEGQVQRAKLGLKKYRESGILKNLRGI